MSHGAKLTVRVPCVTLWIKDYGNTCHELFFVLDVSMILWCLFSTTWGAHVDSVGCPRFGTRTLGCAFIAIRNGLVFVIQPEYSSG